MLDIWKRPPSLEIWRFKQPGGSFPAESSKSLSNSTFSFPFWTPSVRSTVKDVFFKLYWIFLSDNLYVHVLLPLSPKKKFIQPRPLWPKYPNSWARTCLFLRCLSELPGIQADAGTQPILGQRGISCAVVAFHSALPMPSPCIAVICVFHLCSFSLCAWTGDKLSSVPQPSVAYKPKERVNKGLNCLKQWMCPDEFGVIQAVFFSYL